MLFDSASSEILNNSTQHSDNNYKQFFSVINPSNGEELGKIQNSSTVEINDCIIQAKSAFQTWSELTLKERTVVLYRYRNLLEQQIEELSELVHLENGKTLEEARAELEKSIELCEFACSMPQIIANEIQEVSKGVECRIDRKPLGVVACITPFNFPNMVPHWTIPNALVLGNTMLLKPSEHTPLSAIKIAALLKQAGLPEGVLSIVHGGKDAAEVLCDHPDIAAISFVGSTPVAQTIYRRATSQLKRCLALGGAKNHLIVLPDAHLEMTASNVVASMSGCAGQRCMAASVLIGVGEIQPIVDQMIVEAEKVIPGKNLGAVVSKRAKERIEAYIDEAEAAGAKVLVDGRGTSVPGRENGFYVGPTIIDHLRPEMRIAQEEIFGPVIGIIRVADIQAAIEIENQSKYGNAAAIFTQSGRNAKFISEHLDAGMIGVNVGVPVPREPFPFGGWNDSKFGVGDITGKSSIAFWTKNKKVTLKWNPESKINWMS